MIKILNMEKNYRALLTLCCGICIFFIAHSMNAMAPITAVLTLGYLILYRPSIVKTPIFYTTTFFVLWLLVSMVANYSVNLTQNFHIWLWILEYYVIYLTFLIVMDRPGKVYEILKYFTAMTTVFLLFGFCEVFFTSYFENVFYWCRPGSETHMFLWDRSAHVRLLSTLTFFDPNFSGLLLAFGGSATGVFFLTKIKERAWASSLLWFIVLILYVIGCILTYSRGALVTLILSLAFIFGRWAVKRYISRKHMTIIILSIFLSSGLFASYSGNLHLVADKFMPLIQGGNILHNSDTSEQRRLILWQVAGQMVIDHPVFGVGFENFHYYLDNDPVYSSWFPWSKSNIENIHDAHNFVLHYSAIGGIPMAICLSILVYLLIRLCLQKKCNESIGFQNREIVIALLAVFIFNLAFQFPLVNKSVGMLFFIVLAFATKIEEG